MTYSISALRGWATVAIGRWYDGAMRMPEEQPSASRVDAAVDAGLVHRSSIGTSVSLTRDGEELVSLYQSRRTKRDS